MSQTTPVGALLAWLLAGVALILPWDPRVPVPGFSCEHGSGMRVAGADPLMLVTWIDRAHAWWQRQGATACRGGPIDERRTP